MPTKSQGIGSRDPARAGRADHAGKHSTIGWQALSAVLLPTDPAGQHHVLALFGPLLMVT